MSARSELPFSTALEWPVRRVAAPVPVPPPIAFPGPIEWEAAHADALADESALQALLRRTAADAYARGCDDEAARRQGWAVAAGILMGAVMMFVAIKLGMARGTL